MGWSNNEVREIYQANLDAAVAHLGGPWPDDNPDSDRRWRTARNAAKKQTRRQVGDEAWHDLTTAMNQIRHNHKWSHVEPGNFSILLAPRSIRREIAARQPD